MPVANVAITFPAYEQGTVQKNLHLSFLSKDIQRITAYDTLYCC